MITLLNSSVLTNFGEYRYSPLSIDEAVALLKEEGFVSAIGHQETSNFLSSLTGITIPLNRKEYRQEPGEKALIIKIRRRLQVTEILKADEILPGDYECGLLIRIN
jgi:hypothetical protein